MQIRGWAARVRVALGTVILLFVLCELGLAQDPALQQFYNTQVLHAFDGMDHPAAANARVLSIWFELANYSKHRFPVYPAQQFTAGQATLSGIYLDISIAADPSVEVTRFFLAHEWGHMMHGDPLSQFTPLGQYRMLVGGTTVEDSADVYAATFMRYQNHNIKPVVDFFCALPDAGPSDTHSPGPARAAKVARIYGLKGPDPCGSGNDADTDQDSAASPAQGPQQAKQQCRDDYSACLRKIVNADTCIANNVKSCTNACVRSGWCPQGCDESRFQGTCREIEQDSKDRCREKRDDCLHNAEE
jgi:hypothetical protein